MGILRVEIGKKQQLRSTRNNVEGVSHFHFQLSLSHFHFHTFKLYCSFSAVSRRTNVEKNVVEGDVEPELKSSPALFLPSMKAVHIYIEC